MRSLAHIAVHHSGSIGSDFYVSSAHLTFEQIDNAHKLRWPNFKSSMGYWVGYNFIIDQRGNVKQFRALGEETAAQIGHNDDTISICLIGNFTLDAETGLQVDAPSAAQTHTMVQLIASLLDGRFNVFNVVVKPGTLFNLSIMEIWPHRHYQTAEPTSCYGTFLAEDWARKLVLDYQWARLGILKAGVNVLINIYRALFHIPPLTKSISMTRQTAEMQNRACDGHLII